MLVEADRSKATSAVRTQLSAIFISLELSQSKWLMTSLAPGNGEKMSKFTVAARDVAKLLARFAEVQRKAEARTDTRYGFVVIQEAGLDSFWLHRRLEAEGIESYVVDPASIAVSRHAPCEDDRIDGEMLLRTLLAYMCHRHARQALRTSFCSRRSRHSSISLIFILINIMRLLIISDA